MAFGRLEKLVVKLKTKLVIQKTNPGIHERPVLLDKKLICAQI